MVARLKPRFRHVLWRNGSVAILCGLLTFAVVHFFHNTAFFGGEAEDSLDFLMRLQAESGDVPPGPDITLVDFDEGAFVALGRPDIIPRDVLARVAQAGPKLVLLDIDIGWPDAKPREQVLADELSRLAKGPGPMILAVREKLENTSGIATPYLRPSPYDAIAAGSTRVRFIASQIIENEAGVAHYIGIMEPMCRDTTSMVLPGIHPAALAATAPEPMNAFDALDNQLQAYRRPCTANDPPLRPKPLNTMGVAGQNVSWKRNHDTERIPFRLGWQEGAVFSHSSPGLVVLPVSQFLQPNADIDDSLLRSHIVVIGSSAAAMRDMHLTPLGFMPGSLVLGNALRASLGEGFLQESSIYIDLGLTLVISFFTFGVWAILRHFMNVSVLLMREGLKLGMTAFWGILAWTFMRHGAALDFAFPQYVVISYLIYAEGLEATI